MKSDGYGLFLATLEAQGIPAPGREFQFHPVRRWRIDFYWPYVYSMDGPLALEVEGGGWISGRHNHPSGFAKDMEKYREMTKARIWLLRYAPKELLSVAIPELCEIFGVGI